MSDESGFAVDLGELSGGEGEVAAPKRQQHERSPLKVLKSLEEKPLEQAIKAIEYLRLNQERGRRILRAVSPVALDLIAKNGPEFYEAAAQAAQ